MFNMTVLYSTCGAAMAKVIGLIKVLDRKAFDTYRSQVGETVIKHGGVITYRGAETLILWNELGVDDFEACVEIEFPSADAANQWASSAEYQSLLAIRSKAMRLTLFVTNSPK
jgi:uncharacterized protein (DUF1330 family)